MKINLLTSPAASPRAAATASLEARILRLITGARERHALHLGQIDAVIDPTSGRALLLPAAQAALLEGTARFRSLVELTSDGYWEQDEHYRFVLHTGATIGNELACGGDILGKTLWELPIDNDSEIDWQAHRTQLEWRAIFRDLELRCVDRTGKLRSINISGEPRFDAEGHFQGYRGITRASAHQGSRDTPRVEHLARSVLDALTTQVCVLDTLGTVLTVNAAWRAQASKRGCLCTTAVIGSNFLAVCEQSEGDERVDVLVMAAGVRQVLTGERASFRHVYGCVIEHAQRCWFSVSVTAAGDGGAVRAVVAYQDITDLRRAQELLQLEHTVSSIITDNDPVPTTVRAIMRAVCSTLHWDGGRYFGLLPDSDVLCLDESWSTASSAGPIPAGSPRVILRPGAGIVGRVAQSGEPLWMLSGEHDPLTATTALAFEIGPAGVFAFPVIEAGKVCGVLELTGHIVRAPDDRLLHTVRSIGLQLGRYLERRRAAEALGRSEARFRRLTELSSDWIWQQDKQFRFTEIIGNGIANAGNVLGKTLWELPNLVCSEADWLKHKSELAARWSFCDFEITVMLADGQHGYYCISGEPTYDAAGVFSGFHGTGLDITEHKRRELAARAAASASTEP